MAWGKAGSTTLGSAGDDLDITSMTANKFNQFLWHKIASSDAVGSMTFNNNANSVYARRRSTNGGTDSTLVSQAAILYDIGDVNDEFVIGYICSISGEEKLILAFHNNRQATGSGSAPSRGEYTAKFVPSPDADITRIDFNNTTGSGSYDTSSNLSALGSDITPAAAVPFPANVQVGSRFEETDTRKMYHYNEATLTLSLGQTVMSSSPQFNYHAVDIPSASDFIMNFDWTLTGNRDTPYVTLSSDTTAYGDPASGQKKFIMMYANNNGDLRLGARYNDGGASENDITGTGTDLASNVKSYFQLIKSGSSLNYSRYGSASDRTSQTNALQSIATYTLPSTYTSTADFSYLGLGAYSSNGQNTIHEVKLYVGVSSTDTAWTEEGT
tara:strand:+ start:27 stop:1178 length:1152 start_codon:yes stop_codon:yes gene_type:complete